MSKKLTAADPPTHIKPLLKRMREEGVLAKKELMSVILWECEVGGITLPELREIHKTRIWPKGSYNLHTSDAELLLSMLD